MLPTGEPGFSLRPVRSKRRSELRAQLTNPSRARVHVAEIRQTRQNRLIGPQLVEVLYDALAGQDGGHVVEKLLVGDGGDRQTASNVKRSTRASAHGLVLGV